MEKKTKHEQRHTLASSHEPREVRGGDIENFGVWRTLVLFLSVVALVFAMLVAAPPLKYGLRKWEAYWELESSASR